MRPLKNNITTFNKSLKTKSSNDKETQTVNTFH